MQEQRNTISLIKQEITYAILIVISILCVLLQHFSLEKTYKIMQLTKQNTLLGNDDINGGKSLSEYSIVENKIYFKCQTKNTAATWAYCGINVALANNWLTGFNIENYDTVEFNLNYHSTKRDTLLVYLTNVENYGSEVVKRSNVHAFLPSEGKQKVHLKLQDFAVPSWWLLLQSNIDESSLTNFSNVSQIRFVSGDNPIEREINFSVSDIVFKGKWIASDTLYLSLLIIWLLIISFNSFIQFKRISHAYSFKENESKILKNVNKLLAKEREKFEILAQKDPLTKCYNRQGLNNILNTEIAMLIRRKKPCSLILLDIDHFKMVNDSLGHDEGDKVLINIVNLIQNNIKVKDSLARWGGEEFLIICPDTTLENAMSLANNLRKLIQSSTLSVHTGITCSFGVAQMGKKGFDECFKKVDAALYQAKALGRNNVQAG